MVIGPIASAAGHAEADQAEAVCPPDSAAACFCSQGVVQAVAGGDGVEDAEMKPWRSGPIGMSSGEVEAAPGSDDRK